MPYVKNTTYIDMPFSHETAKGDFYTYSNLRDLPDKCVCAKDDITRCRTIGILQSIHGKFFLSEIEPEAKSGILVQLSVVYLKNNLPSTVIPYPVQVFGSLQWRNRPVIYAKLVQVLNTGMALRMSNTMNSVTKMHLARQNLEEMEDLTCSDTQLDVSLDIFA